MFDQREIAYSEPELEAILGAIENVKSEEFRKLFTVSRLTREEFINGMLESTEEEQDMLIINHLMGQ